MSQVNACADHQYRRGAKDAVEGMRPTADGQRVTIHLIGAKKQHQR